MMKLPGIQQIPPSCISDLEGITCKYCKWEATQICMNEKQNKKICHRKFTLLHVDLIKRYDSTSFS